MQLRFYIFTITFGLFYYATFHKIETFTNLNQEIATKIMVKASIKKALPILKLLGLTAILTLDFRVLFPPITIGIILRTALVTIALDIVWNYEQRVISSNPAELVSKFTTSTDIRDLHHQIFNSLQFRQKIFDNSEQPTLWKRILVKCEAEIDSHILELKKKSDGNSVILN